MKDLATLQELLRLSQATYDQQRQGLVQLQQKETKLRGDLQRLDALNTPTTAPSEGFGDMQLLGADLLWQGWCGRAKTQLNMELARLLALKAQEQAKVRKAFGRVEAVRSLLETELAKQRKGVKDRSLQLAIDQTLFGPQ